MEKNLENSQTENFMTANKKIFDYIDSLQDNDTAKNLISQMGNAQLKNIFWEAFEKFFVAQTDLEKNQARLKIAHINHLFASSIPLNPYIKKFTAPHGFYGIFISLDAKIGKGCTIYQHVTIGSNTLIDSKSAGAPVIGNNVYIGAGAKIIGNVKIGNNVRIGAGCIVTKDVPENSTVVQTAPIVIQKNIPQENRWLPISDYNQVKSSENRYIENPSCLPDTYVIPVSENNLKVMYRVIDSTTQKKYESAFRILFCGDLILLEDQVKRAFDGKKYNFDDMFEFTKKYISSADFSIGVFEGPMGGS